MKQNMKTIINKIVAISMILLPSFVSMAREYSAKDLDVLLSEEALYSNIMLRYKKEYREFEEWLDGYKAKQTPEGFDERALEIITSFDYRRLLLENQEEYYVLDDRGSLFCVLLYMNQSFRRDTKPYMKIADYLAGIHKFKKGEYKFTGPKRMWPADRMAAINDEISRYRRAILRSLTRELPDLKRIMSEDDFNAFTNKFVEVGRLTELERIGLKEHLIPYKEHTKMLGDYWDGKKKSSNEEPH